MSAVTSPSETNRSAVHGVAELCFERRSGRTALAHLYQRAPLRVLFPRPIEPDLPLAALVLTSGGLVGGDRLDVAVRVGEAAAAVVAGQAAEKVYRSAGEPCRLDVRLAVDASGWLEWLPQETILFDGSRLRRRTRLDAASGGRILAGEILVFGRIARGERLTAGVVHDAWEVSCGGRRAWTDAFRLAGEPSPALAHPAGLNGATACATAVYVGEDAVQRLVTARELLGSAVVRAAATCVGGVLVVRWLGAEAAAVRRSFGAFWAEFRERVAGLPPVLPRLWHV